MFELAKVWRRKVLYSMGLLCELSTGDIEDCTKNVKSELRKSDQFRANIKRLAELVGFVVLEPGVCPNCMEYKHDAPEETGAE